MTTDPLLQRALAAVVSCFLLFAGAARGQDKPASLSKEKLDGIERLLKKAVDDKKFAGGTALVAQRGKVVYRADVGMQDVEGKVPIAEGTIFRIASMSKPITSVAVMILVDEGKLNVTDPLSKYVPEFRS